MDEEILKIGVEGAAELNLRVSDEHLRRLAWEDHRNGGRGRAHAALALPVKPLIAAYGAAPIEERGDPLLFDGHLLDDNVLAVLPEVETRKYRWNHANTNWQTGASF